MSEKTKYNVWIPDQIAESFLDLDDFVTQLISFYPYLSLIDFVGIKKIKNFDQSVDETTEEYNQICQQFGKVMQEYGVVNFRGNELFTRNTVTGLKLGLLMGKLERAKSMWGDKLNLDYQAARKLIQHFSDRYLIKKEED